MPRFVNSNNIVNKIQNRDTGKTEYTVSLGNVVFNDSIRNLDGIIIPIHDEIIFDLPGEENKYAAVNVYLDPRKGGILYDKVSVSGKLETSVNADCLFNAIPLAQFILHQVGDAFEVVHINEYSRMGTFALTTSGETGPEGLDGPEGFAGAVGAEGERGLRGATGQSGPVGPRGVTGQAVAGNAGPHGEPGDVYDGG